MKKKKNQSLNLNEKNQIKADHLRKIKGGDDIIIEDIIDS